MKMTMNFLNRASSCMNIDAVDREEEHKHRHRYGSLMTLERVVVVDNKSTLNKLFDCDDATLSTTLLSPRCHDLHFQILPTY